MQILDYFHLSLIQFLIIILVAVLIGIGKTGISATTLLAVPLMAAAVESKTATGMILIMFLLGDLFAVRAYSRSASWSDIRRLLPAAVAGIVLGTLVGKWVNDRQFKILIAGILFICLILMIYQEMKGGEIKAPKNRALILIIGIICGFATMIGNAAAPIFAVYLLAIQLDKERYLGTTAWFFFILNMIKMPLQIFIWNRITVQNVLAALLALPAIYLGTRLGIMIVRKLPEKLFRRIIIGMTFVAAAAMLV